MSVYNEYGTRILPCGSQVCKSGVYKGKWFVWLRTGLYSGRIMLASDSILYFDNEENGIKAIEVERETEVRLGRP